MLASAGAVTGYAGRRLIQSRDAPPEHRLHRGRRPRLCRPRLLRRAGSRLAGARPVRRARPALTQCYANSPVCSPTRFALMTGRYQYRLRGAAEEPINSGAAAARPRPAGRASHPAVAAARPPAIGRRWSASGTSASRRSARCARVTRVLRADVGRRRLLQPLRFARPHDLWAGEEEHREQGYLTDLISRRAVVCDRALPRPPAAVLPQPALHRAALALGNAR